MWSQGYLAKETKLLLDIRWSMSAFKSFFQKNAVCISFAYFCFVLQFVQCSLLEWQDRFICLILGQAELQIKTFFASTVLFLKGNQIMDMFYVIKSSL